MAAVGRIDVMGEDLESLAWALSLEQALLGEQWNRREWALSITYGGEESVEPFKDG